MYFRRGNNGKSKIYCIYDARNKGIFYLRLPRARSLYFLRSPLSRFLSARNPIVLGGEECRRNSQIKYTWYVTRKWKNGRNSEIYGGGRESLDLSRRGCLVSESQFNSPKSPLRSRHQNECRRNETKKFHQTTTGSLIIFGQIFIYLFIYFFSI